MKEQGIYDLSLKAIGECSRTYSDALRKKIKYL